MNLSTEHTLAVGVQQLRRWTRWRKVTSTTESSTARLSSSTFEQARQRRRGSTAARRSSELGSRGVAREWRRREKLQMDRGGDFIGITWRLRPIRSNGSDLPPLRIQWRRFRNHWRENLGTGNPANLGFPYTKRFSKQNSLSATENFDKSWLHLFRNSMTFETKYMSFQIDRVGTRRIER